MDAELLMYGDIEGCSLGRTSSGCNPLVSDTTGTVNNYVDCYNKLTDSNSGFQGELSASEQAEFEEFMADVWEFLKDIEDEFNCGGICYTPLFGITSDVSEGRPDKECLDAIFKATFGRAGAISVSGAIFLFITLGMSLSLCGGRPDTDGEETTQVEKV